MVENLLILEAYFFLPIFLGLSAVVLFAILFRAYYMRSIAIAKIAIVAQIGAILAVAIIGALIYPTIDLSVRLFIVAT